IDGYGSITPLHLAVYSPKLVKALLENNADHAAKDSRGETPLDWAVHEGNEKSIRLLIAAGAKRIGITRDEK
ncbi:MAG: ankyrin repeat domain-containing protein, partial [Planctomycetaceae bacterium]|nr:ankyrin repeat domain-containing protein [Planctomycetaceae bacterium]